MKKLGLYVHIPFCVKKCRYCDFLSGPYDEGERARYVKALVAEIAQKAEQFKDYSVDTIYIGGGTPSLLTAEQIAGIMETIRERYRLEPYTECTIECNPGTVDERKAESWLLNGINRVSIGLQSANNRELQGLGRIHTAEEFLDGYLLLSNMGFSNINVDLMCALPFQTEESFYGTLRSVAGLGPKHLSVYSLIVEEGTSLYDWVHAGNEDKLPSEETERNMYYKTREILGEYGYHRYEVSNYAKPGYECRHNLGYWERKEYAGFGLGASSLTGNRRYKNVSSWEAYIENHGSEKADEEVLDRKDAMAEFMFLGLRKTEGIDKETFYNAFGVDYDDIYGEITETLAGKGFLDLAENHVRLTDLGIDVSNVVLAEFLPD
ncbi:MAG: radical SAM family heme chaperone HemW [Alistipes sp.]|nr:radical SAM family heme chaperone HemW [Alistipes sp.]